MPTYDADNYRDPMPTNPGVGVSLCREFLFTVAVALAVNDIIRLMPIAQGSGMVIEDWFMDSEDLDSGGAAIRLEFGDPDTAAKFMAANLLGSAALKADMVTDGVLLSIPVEYAAGADKDLRLTVSTGPTTGATGVTIRGWVKYHRVGIDSPV